MKSNLVNGLSTPDIKFSGKSQNDLAYYNKKIKKGIPIGRDQ